MRDHSSNRSWTYAASQVSQVEFQGGNDNDDLMGDSGNDQLNGQADIDRFWGGNGNDVLIAIDGNTGEFVQSDSGSDVLWVDRNGRSTDGMAGNSGVAILIGRLGNGLTSAGDLIILNGTLFALVNKPGSATTWLAKINPATGKATLVGNTGHPDVWGLEIRSGVMLAAAANGRIVRLNPQSGVAAIVGSNSVSMGGLAKSP